MPVKKAYILMELGYEYNDQIYYRNEDDGAWPERIYLNKQDAEKACDKANLEKYKGLELLSYCDSLEEICENPEELQAWMTANSSDPEMLAIPTNITDQELKTIYNMINLVFYRVLECDVDEAIFSPDTSSEEPGQRFVKVSKEL